MWNSGKELENQLLHLENLKAGIMKQINKLNYNTEAITPTKVFPVSKVKPLEINGYPVIQFHYDGLLPHYVENNEYKRLLRSYYFHSTVSAYDFEGMEGLFDEVVIIYCQYFKDNIIRDLENRNMKYIQDAIRSTQIIKDDDWNNVWNMNLGLYDEKMNHVQVYVVEKNKFLDFYSYLIENHEELKETNEFVLVKDKFLEKHRRELIETYGKKTDEEIEEVDIYNSFFNS